MSKEKGIIKILKLIYSCFTFFLTVAFVITCCIILFTEILMRTTGIDFTSRDLGDAAKLTFLNVIFFSVLFTVIDIIRRKYMVDRPAKRIVDATKNVMQGDFNTRIEPIRTIDAQNRFNEIIECFNKMTEEISGIETLRTDFIANVSHELKTPLSVIQNYGILLQSDDLTQEERQEYAKGIVNSTRRLSEMITNILKLNRLENQKIYPQANKYNLGEQLFESILQFEAVLESKNIEIETEILDDVLINADAELLSLVWNNLLSNAFKFTKDNGKVFVSLTETQNHAIVKIKDTGIGMSREIGNHIFEKFYQGDTSHSVQGNGLGLALVKRVIDIVQGEISVESAVNVGSTFTVKIQKNI